MPSKIFQRAELKKKFSKPKSKTKSPKSKILIICGDKKTEPNYFTELRNFLRVNGQNALVRSAKHSTPSAVLKFAIEELKKDNEYDNVYCVFDKDNFNCYQETLDKISKRRDKKIIAINSVPCFEIWVLLHFEATSSPFNSCSDLEKRIKKHKKDYNKDKKPLTYSELKDRTKTAIKNAKQLAKNGSENPFTNVHILVEVLEKQAKDDNKR